MKSRTKTYQVAKGNRSKHASDGPKNQVRGAQHELPRRTNKCFPKQGEGTSSYPSSPPITEVRNPRTSEKRGRKVMMHHRPEGTHSFHNGTKANNTKTGTDRLSQGHFEPRKTCSKKSVFSNGTCNDRGGRCVDSDKTTRKTHEELRWHKEGKGGQATKGVISVDTFLHQRRPPVHLHLRRLRGVIGSEFRSLDRPRNATIA